MATVAKGARWQMDASGNRMLWRGVLILGLKGHIHRRPVSELRGDFFAMINADDDQNPFGDKSLNPRQRMLEHRAVANHR
jgi:hypothetical protein